MALPTQMPAACKQTASFGAIIGPFLSSAGNVYAFGQDNTTATSFNAYKATDPTTSFSVIATQTGFSTAILNTDVPYTGIKQPGSDVVHIIIYDGTAASANVKYVSFNMATDTFGSTENIVTAVNLTNLQSTLNTADICYRTTDNNPIVIFNGATGSSGGKQYSRVYWSHRTGTNTWSTATELDAGGATLYVNSNVVMGNNNIAHFLWGAKSTIANLGIFQKSLSTGSTLNTGSSATGSSFSGAAITDPATIQYDSISNTALTSIISVGELWFNSTTTPTLAFSTDNSNVADEPSGGQGIFDGSTAYTMFTAVVAVNNSAVLALASTGSGQVTWQSSAAWSTAYNRNNQLIAGGCPQQRVSVYTRGGNRVIGMLIYESGTPAIFYNEFILASLVSGEYNQAIFRMSSGAWVW